MGRKWLLLAAIGLVLAACGAPDPVAEPSPESSPAATAATGRPTPLPTSPGPDTVPFHLQVTNSSFEIPEVRLIIELDGEVVIDDVFAVGDQHNWVGHDLYLEPGDHDVVVTAPEHGVDMTESFTLDDERWALVAFWHGEADASEPMSWSFSDVELFPM